MSTVFLHNLGQEPPLDDSGKQPFQRLLYPGICRKTKAVNVLFRSNWMVADSYAEWLLHIYCYFHFVTNPWFAYSD